MANQACQAKRETSKLLPPLRLENPHDLTLLGSPIRSDPLGIADAYTHELVHVFPR